MLVMSRLVWDRMNFLFPNDVTHLADPIPTKIWMQPIVGDFTPRPDLVYADLIFALGGFTQIFAAAIPGQILSANTPQLPLSWTTILLASAISWSFVCDNTAQPFTVYGFALSGNAGQDLYFVEKFPTPLVFNGPNLAVFHSNEMFTIPPTVMVND